MQKFLEKESENFANNFGVENKQSIFLQKIIIKDKIQLQHILFSHFLLHSFLRISEKFREKIRNTSEKDCKIRAKIFAYFAKRFVRCKP